MEVVHLVSSDVVSNPSAGVPPVGVGDSVGVGVIFPKISDHLPGLSLVTVIAITMISTTIISPITVFIVSSISYQIKLYISVRLDNKDRYMSVL
jgi:hypothetical protein